MPEGYEMSVHHIGAEVVRQQEGESGKILCGVHLRKPWPNMPAKKKGRFYFSCFFCAAFADCRLHHPDAQ
jgi:hypothetical protein